MIASTSSSPLDLVGRLASVSLAEMNDAAALQQRIDRKYIVDHHQLGELVHHLGSRLAALEIDGTRSFGYESTYFDTLDLRCFHDAARKRRRRFKVRTRTYLDTDTSMLEIKERGRAGITLKQRCPHRFDDRAALDAESEAFIDGVVGQPGLATTLFPTLTTRYRRTTLVDLDDIARVTIDDGLRCADWNSREVRLDDRYILETKSSGRPSVTDRRLWAMGIRPAKISKYGTGLAALHPELPSNKWHRTLQRHF